MFKDNRYINAGVNEIYRYGHKAVEKVQACLIPNDQGWLSIPTDGGKYWTIGTSTGKFGEFAKFDGVCFSVNRGGFMYAKVGTEKGDKFIDVLNRMITKMNELNEARFTEEEESEEE